MEYFVTYLRKVSPACRRMGKRERKPDCFENVKGQKGRGCIADSCDKITWVEEFRCSLGELNFNQKRDFDRKIVAKQEQSGKFEIDSKNKLGLVGLSKKTIEETGHTELIDNFNEQIKQYKELQSKGIYIPLDGPIKFMWQCSQFADEIRAKYKQQIPPAKLLPVNDVNTVNQEQLELEKESTEKPKKERRTAQERRLLLYEAVNYALDNPTIPKTKIATEWGLESTALSKPDATELFETLEKERGKRIRDREKVSKEVGDDFVDSQQNNDEY